MSHHKKCHSNSCCHSHSHHSHHEECCDDDSCACDCACHKKQKYCDQLLKLADAAWMEVLKEEIKKEIIKHSGEHLKKTAELVSRTNHKRWSEKMEEKHNVEAFEEELRNLMCHKQK